MPHQVPFSLANLSILDCALTSAPKSWHASFGCALRSFAALIAAAFFSASSRSLKNSWTQGGTCCCDGGCCCGGCGCALAAMATNGTMQRLNIARRNLMKPTPPGKCHYTSLEGANNNPNASGRRQLGMACDRPRDALLQCVDRCWLRPATV